MYRVCSVLLLLLLAACAPSLPATLNDHECLESWDCDANEICKRTQGDWNACVALSCESHADCPSRTVCNPESNLCTFYPAQSAQDCVWLTQCGAFTNAADMTRWQRALFTTSGGHTFCTVEETTCNSPRVCVPRPDKLPYPVECVVPDGYVPPAPEEACPDGEYRFNDEVYYSVDEQQCNSQCREECVPSYDAVSTNYEQPCFVCQRAI